MAVRKINRVCLCKWPYLFQHAEEGPNVLHRRKSVHTHMGVGPALRGWHKPRRCFAGWQLGALRAAAVLSTGFWELLALQAELKWAGWLFRAGRKGVLLWHPQPCGRHQQRGRTHSPHGTEQTPAGNWFKILICYFSVWLLNGSWTNPDIISF